MKWDPHLFGWMRNTFSDLMFVMPASMLSHAGQNTAGVIKNKLTSAIMRLILHPFYMLRVLPFCLCGSPPYLPVSFHSLKTRSLA